MRRVSLVLVVLGFMALAVVATASARRHPTISGFIRCDTTNIGVFDSGDTPLANVTVVVTDGVDTFTAVTDTAGAFTVDIYKFGTFNLTLQNLPATATGVSPTLPFNFTVTYDDPFVTQNFLVSDPNCALKGCWMTGGGMKIETVTGLPLAEKGAKHSFGGNVYPGCSSTAGDGGSWNHVAHAAKLHFHARTITVVRCGNVPGIEPGSTSPVTPYNFIEYTGTGTLVGIKGNKADYGTVYFFARVEDRNEPGNEGALGTGGENVDRYFIKVYLNPANPNGSVRLLLDGDLDPATVDPVPITHGNLQLHISSCSTPPAH